MSESAPAEGRSSRRRLPRFSLATALLLMAIVALSTTVWRLWSEVEPLRVENKRLNEERGTLVIEDRSKLQAIKIPSRFAGEGMSSYRVFVPEGTLYWAFLVVNDISKEGYPQLKRFPDRHGILGSGTNLPLFGRLEPGEHVVSIKTVPHGPKRKDVQLAVDFLSARANTKPNEWPSVSPEASINFGDGIRSQTTTADNSNRLVLQRSRHEATASDPQIIDSIAPVEPTYPLDGVMLWIEPDRPSP